MLTGVFFAFAYKAAGEFGSVPFFGSAGHGSLSQDLFFSFVTMTTVGYGTLRPGNPSSAGWIPGSYCRMLIARAITSAPRPRDTTASIIISSLAHRLIAEMSVGLNAVAVQKASDR